MGSIELSSEESGSVSILSNIFIDHYMPEANGTFVKIYLYLLRCLQANRRVSIPEIADRLSCTDNDVKRGISYWINKGILQMNFDNAGNPTSIVLCHLTEPNQTEDPLNFVSFQLLRQENREGQPAQQENAPAAVIDPETKSSRSAASRQASEAQAVRDRQPSLESLRSALEDPSFVDLRDQAQAYFGRTLSSEDINALWRIYDDMKLPFEVCEYLLEYCAADLEGHPERTLPAYYEKVARNWAEHRIATRKSAEDFTRGFFFGTRLLRALGVRDRYLPTDAENRLLEEWRAKYHFSEEMLLLACERAVIRNPRSASFGYVGGILESWFRQGLTTPDAVEKLDNRNPGNAPAGKSASGQTRSGSKPAGGNFMQGNLSVEDLDLLEQLSAGKIKES